MYLRECAQLQHVAVQRVDVQGLVFLPAGCLLHVFGEPYPGCNVTPALAGLVSGLTLRHISSQKLKIVPHMELLGLTPQMTNLKQLRLILSKGMVGKHTLRDSLDMHFIWGMAPKLEVLELDVHCSLCIFIDPTLPLKSLTVITVGRLEFLCLSGPMSTHVPKDTLEQVYLQSEVSLSRTYKDFLPEYFSRELWPPMKLSTFRGERQSGWTVQMPATFLPSNLQECCCMACPECLVRADVPILCPKAWTSDGFDKYLRPHCKRGC